MHTHTHTHMHTHTHTHTHTYMHTHTHTHTCTDCNQSPKQRGRLRIVRVSSAEKRKYSQYKCSTGAFMRWPSWYVLHSSTTHTCTSLMNPLLLVN